MAAVANSPEGTRASKAGHPLLEYVVGDLFRVVDGDASHLFGSSEHGATGWVERENLCPSHDTALSDGPYHWPQTKASQTKHEWPRNRVTVLHLEVEAETGSWLLESVFDEFECGERGCGCGDCSEERGGRDRP